MTFPESVPLFLGVARSASHSGRGWSVLDLSHVLAFPYFPQTLKGLQAVIAVSKNRIGSGGFECRLRFTDDTRPDNQAWSDFTFKLVRHDWQVLNHP